MALALTISGMQARSQSSVKAEPLSVTLGGCCLQTLLSACHNGKKIISILPGALKLKECEMYCKQISHKKGEDNAIILFFFSSQKSCVCHFLQLLHRTTSFLHIPPPTRYNFPTFVRPKTRGPIINLLSRSV